MGVRDCGFFGKRERGDVLGMLIIELLKRWVWNV